MGQLGGASRFNNPYGRARRRVCVQACMRHAHERTRQNRARKKVHAYVRMHAAFVTTRICCEAFKVLLYFKKQLHKSRKHSKRYACLRSFPPRVCMHACYSLHIFSSLSTRNVNCQSSPVTCTSRICNSTCICCAWVGVLGHNGHEFIFSTAGGTSKTKIIINKIKKLHTVAGEPLMAASSTEI